MYEGHWTLSFQVQEQAWSAEWGGRRRAMIPLSGARSYHDGTCHLSSVHSSYEGDFTVAQCVADIGGGMMIHLRDVARLCGSVIELHRSWWHTESNSLPGVELLIEVLPDGVMEEHLVPGCLYDGNAQAASERLVPRLKAIALFEEHKCPTPMAYACFRGIDGARIGVTLLPEPCAVVDGHVPDQWWSLGLRTAEQQIALLCVSGRLAVNGEQEKIYDAQNHVSPYLDAYVDARPHHVYEKHVRVNLQAHPSAAWSWRKPQQQIIAAQPPLTHEEDALISAPALEEAIRLKAGYALRRWHDDDRCAGMLWYPQRAEFQKTEQSVEYGWVGQNMRLGLSMWRWGRRIKDTDLCRRGERCAEAWGQIASGELAAGRVAPTRYIIAKGWRDTDGGDAGYSRPTTETLFEFADFCRQQRQAGSPQADWERTLFTALEFYAQPQRCNDHGLLPLKWNRLGQPQDGPMATAGVLMVAALAEAAALPGGERWLNRANEMWDRYADVYLGDAPRHPCGSALDSCCEDMESGMFLLMASTHLAQAMRLAGRSADARLLQQAMRAADWVLSWTYTWNVPLLGRTVLASMNFNTRGLSDVSVQNRHLHVFSACAEILRLAAELGGTAGEYYRQQARRMLVPVVRTIARPNCRWAMDEDGEQTEQYNHTNYIQHPHDPVCRPRGGIARWFVPWITVWVMSVCLDFLDDAHDNAKMK